MLLARPHWEVLAPILAVVANPAPEDTDMPRSIRGNLRVLLVRLYELKCKQIIQMVNHRDTTQSFWVE